MLIKALNTIIIAYAMMVVAALTSIPLGYAFAPVFYFVQSIPLDVKKYALELFWSLGFCIVATWIIEDYWPQAADRSDRRGRPWRLRLPDLAPWLQTVSTDSDEFEQRALSPRLKSLPLPARD